MKIIATTLRHMGTCGTLANRPAGPSTRQLTRSRGSTAGRDDSNLNARHLRDYPENDVPHPHVFEEFGFTNTKPCCISVS
jgi:hypothetical protein